MKSIITAVLLLVPVAASAEVWVAQTCDMMLESRTGAERPFVFTAAARNAECRVYSWPMNTDVATMECSDGTRPTMALMPSGQVVFDGIHLYPKGHEAVDCH